jgi:hypothetical protein
METPDQPENEIVDAEEYIDYTRECINISIGLRASGAVFKTIDADKAIAYIDKVKDCYEVINEEVNRVYGDVDFKDVNKQFELAGKPYTEEEFNAQDRIYRDALTATIEYLLEKCEQPRSAYCLFTASSYKQSKISWRYVLNNVIASKASMKYLLGDGLNDLFQLNQDRYTTINNHHISFDNQPYSPGFQKMRMVGTSKPDENRPLVMVKGQVKDSFISYIPEGCIKLPEPPAEPEISYNTNNITNSTNLLELSDLLEILPKKYLETLKGNPPTVKYGAFQIINAILNSYKLTPELKAIILQYIPRPNNRNDIKWVNDVIRRYTPPAPGIKPLTIATLYYLVEDKTKLQALRDKYKKVYYKEIVGYTLPKDWDLLDDHQNEQGYLRDIPTTLTSVLVESHLGTGKTTQIKKLIKGQTHRRSEPLKLVKSKTKTKTEHIKQSSILVICPRITFSQNMYNDYGVDNDFKLYSDIKGDLSDENRLFIQMESLHRLENRASYDYIILDEIESILRQASPGSTHKNYKKSIETFERLITGAKYVIGMDAFVSNRAIDMFNYLRKNDTKTLVRNNHNPYKRQAIEIDKDEVWAKNLITLQEKKRCITISSSIKKLQGFEAILTEKDVKYLSYHSEDDKTLRKSSLQDVNESWAEVDAVLYTSSVSVGINYDNIDKPFSQLFMYASAGGSIPRDLFQGSLRARNLTENLLTFSIDERTARPQGCNTEEISLMIDDRNQSVVEYLKGFDITEYNNLSNWNRSVILRNKAEDNISKWEYRRVFYYYLEKCGYTTSSADYGLESLALPEKDMPNYDDIEMIGELKREELERKMINGDDITEAEKYQLDKYYFLKKMGEYKYLLDDEDNRAILYSEYWCDKHKGRKRITNLIDELRFSDTIDRATNIVRNADNTLELMSDKPIKIRAIKSLQSIITVKKDYTEDEFRDMLKNKDNLNILITVFKAFNMLVESDITKNSNVYYAKKIATVFDSWAYDVFKNKEEGKRGGRGKQVKYYSHHYSEGDLRKLFNTPKPDAVNTVVSNDCLIVDDVEDVIDEAEEAEEAEEVVEPVEPVDPVEINSIIQEVYDFGADDIKWLNEMNSQFN